MDKKEQELKSAIDEAILALEGPYHWLHSKCYWLGILGFSDEKTQKFHAWHSRLQLRFSVQYQNAFNRSKLQH